MIFEWYPVPAGEAGPELRADVACRSGRTVCVRLLVGGRVVTYDTHRLRDIVAPRAWRTLADAEEIAIELLLTLDMLEDAQREIAARARDRARGFARDRSTDRDEVRELRRVLDDPARVVHALGLGEGAKRQPRGLLICCPAHADRTPSCSVRVAHDGTIAARCQACGWSGDVLGLIAAARGFDVRRDFRRTLQAAAEIAGIELRRAS